MVFKEDVSQNTWFNKFIYKDLVIKLNFYLKENTEILSPVTHRKMCVKYRIDFLISVAY